MVKQAPVALRGTWIAAMIPALALWSAPALADPSCADLMPPTGMPSGAPHAITATELIRLRTIGSPDASTLDVPTPIVASPDGTRLAFVMSRADPATNAYCRGLVVLDIAAHQARLVDLGGDYLSFGGFIRGLYVDIGTPLTVAPVWSRDGESLFYLKRVRNRTAVWQVDAAGGGARLLADPGFDAEALVRLPDSDTLMIAGRPDWPMRERLIDREAITGWLFDARVITNYGFRPQVREQDVPLRLYALDPASAGLSSATNPQAAAYGTAMGLASSMAARAPDGGNVSIVAASRAILGPSTVRVERPGAAPVDCRASACLGRVFGVWWSPRDAAVYFLKHEGWANEATALYRWVPGTSAPSRVFRSLDAIQGCVLAGSALLCTSESATAPRTLVSIDLASGRMAPLFDPNPEAAAISFPRVERLRWRNDRGLEAWGDLVLPQGYRPGTRVPMVVVQYHSRGFLRGGTNDEYPIYHFAEHGMAVLSIERPPFIGVLDPTLTTVAAIERANIAGWAEHKSLFSSLETGVRMAIAHGVADPRRLGITGLSDGATLARYALINSRLFKAAAISSCCFDPNTVMAYGGLAWAKANLATGFPSLRRPDPAFWAPMSLAQNAAQIDTPILMQLADREALLAMEAYEALREYGKPVELVVFPDEYHGKWQPAHRLAVYERSVDWFRFWLNGEQDRRTDKAAQMRRWTAMRDALVRDQSARAQASASTRRKRR